MPKTWMVHAVVTTTWSNRIEADTREEALAKAKVSDGFWDNADESQNGETEWSVGYYPEGEPGSADT